MSRPACSGCAPLPSRPFTAFFLTFKARINEVDLEGPPEGEPDFEFAEGGAVDSEVMALILF
jgi:hypothetical protein